MSSERPEGFYGRNTDRQRCDQALAAPGEGDRRSDLHQPYGIDSSFRDPSGNSIRLTQVRETVWP
jgi:hypothetical protein